GYELLLGRIKDVNFPVLCCNVTDKETGRPIAEPYTILERGGYRIGVIGATTETLTGETHPLIANYVDVHPATPVVRNLAQYLRGIDCDIVIALTHQGYPRDLELAEAVPELDVIIGGHTHTKLYEATRVGDVIVSQTYEWGKQIGVMKLSFERDSAD